MGWITLIVAIVAVIFSIWALKRTGGLDEMKTKVDTFSSLGLAEMKKQVESFSSMSESLREKTADVLDRLEKKVRGEEK
jgi:uncharacterized protein YoxC